MKYVIHILFLTVCSLLPEMSVFAADSAIPVLKCAPTAGPVQETSGVCTDPESVVYPAVSGGSLLILLPMQKNQIIGKDTQRTADDSTFEPARQSPETNKKTIVYFFWGSGCPHCEEEKLFLDTLKRTHSALESREYEVWLNRENAGLMADMLRAYGEQFSGIPVTFVDNQVFSGFSAQTGTLIGKAIDECRTGSCEDPAERLHRPEQQEQGTHTPLLFTAEEPRIETSVTIPLLGTFDARNFSLPVLTLVIAGIDSLNPCAFFVLLTLLGLLVHAQSRNKMLLIGGIFVFFSGFIYFIFMAAWLNLFLIMGHGALITTIAGFLSIVIAGINIKDFFLFKKGISLTIPDSAKPKMYDRMRKLLRSDSLVSVLTGATALAVVANFYELLCTAGFPLLFTRILTLSNLSSATYYLYLLLYNIVYVVPLFMIVLGFTLTLGRRQLSEWQGRVLKLVSGVMMLGLGTVLIVNPALLNSVIVSFIILASSLALSLLVAAVTRKSRG